MLHWVQGMRDPGDVDPSQPWMEVLFYRFNAQFSMIPAGDKTQASEAALGLAANVYYYVGFCHPQFGDLIVAHAGAGAAEVEETAVTPFDTGGLVHDWVRTRTPLTMPEKSELVRESTFDRAQYWLELEAWMNDSFTAVDKYICGRRPTAPRVAMIDMTDEETDPRSWVWEGRVPAKDYEDFPLEAVRVFAPARKRREFLDWVRGTRVIPREDMAAYIQWTNGLFVATDVPVQEMQQFIEEGS